jgi:diguanylate cyclase (GGDEF)-like protein
LAIGAGRLAGTGLAIAAMSIVAMALLARFELDREAALHRDVIASLQLKESLEDLRTQLNDLKSAARLAAGSSADAQQVIERRAVEIDAELQYLAQHPLRADPRDGFAELAQASRLLVVNARSLAARMPAGGAGAAGEFERVAAEASLSLERTLAAHRRRVTESTLAQIRIGETLRGYVSWLLAGSVAVLLGLFGFYRWARLREARALRRIEHIAHHDAVTGLPNRALLADRVEQEIARSIRERAGFALMLFDLDGFKAVNDVWGHAAGDAVLAIVAARARGCIRASDTVGRLGGDEFLAILPGASHEGALAVAEKVRLALSEPYGLAECDALLSVSIGVSFFPLHGNDSDALQRVADAALYEAKRAGKNRIRIAGAANGAVPVTGETPAVA